MLKQCLTGILCMLFALSGFANSLVNVNGDTITIADYNSFISHFKAKSYAQANIQERKKILLSMINRQLLVQEAQKKKLDIDPQYQEQLKTQLEKHKKKLQGKEADFKKSTLVKLLLYKLEQRPEFSFAYLKKDYATKQQKKSREFLIRQIMLDSEKDALATLKRLKKGEKFPTLAKAVSLDISANEGGELGWISQAAVPPAFAEAMNIAEGQYSQKPFKTAFGWHLIYVESIRNIDIPSFDKIKEQFRQEKFGQHIQSLLQNLHKKATITFNK